MACKCTCGNCCTHGEEAKVAQQKQNEQNNARMKAEAEKRKHRNQAAHYRPK